jgi:hypothetical protein
MMKLNVVLKLEGDWITWIDVAQQAIEAAKHVMEETPQKVDERFELACAATNGAHLPGQQRMAA